MKNRTFISIVYPLSLAALVLAGWFPRSCPVLQQVLGGCSKRATVEKGTLLEQELKRIPHKTVEEQIATFSVKSQDFRKTTDVKFAYIAEDPQQFAILKLWTDTGPTPVSIITHPLLTSLQWPRITTTQPATSLFQRNATFESIASFTTNLPAKNLVAVDAIIAKRLSLNSTQYTPLESLETLDGIDYVLTTYEPPLPDGVWRQYKQTFDATEAFISQKNELEWQIEFPNYDKVSKPFRMSTVHIDYRTMK